MNTSVPQSCPAACPAIQQGEARKNVIQPVPVGNDLNWSCFEADTPPPPLLPCQGIPSETWVITRTTSAQKNMRSNFTWQGHPPSGSGSSPCSARPWKISRPPPSSSPHWSPWSALTCPPRQICASFERFPQPCTQRTMLTYLFSFLVVKIKGIGANCRDCCVLGSTG